MMQWTPEAIIGAVTLLAGFVVWLLRLEHRLSKSVTYADYERMDNKRGQTIENLLNRLELKLDEREDKATEHRDWVRDQLISMWKEISALETEAGIFRSRRDMTRASRPGEPPGA